MTAHTGFTQADTGNIVYIGWNFLPVKNIDNAIYFGNYNHLKGKRYELTIYTFNNEKVAFGEYKGRNLKKKQGVFAVYNEQNQIIISANYRKNILYGVYQRFYENGKLSDSGYKFRGSNKGIWKSWYSTGQLKEISFYSFKRGYSTLENEYTSWNPGGSLDDSGHYRNNQRHGIWIEWLQSGIIKSVGEYKNGWKKGLWRYYDSKGKLLYMRRFSSFKYDEEGEYIPIREK